jgi:hypothetical protein
MNTRSAREYIVFTPARLLRNWSYQRPSSKGGLDSSVTVEVGRVYYTGGGAASDLIFVPYYLIVVGLRFKFYNL